MLKKVKHLFLLLLCGCLFFSCKMGVNPSDVSSGILTCADFTIIFDTTGGEPIESIFVKAGTDVLDIEIPTPVREEYHFEKWVDENGIERWMSTYLPDYTNGSKYYDYYSVFEFNTEPNIYFNAVWTNTNPTITFSADGGYFDMPDGTKPEKIVYTLKEIKELVEYKDYFSEFVESKKDELYLLARKEHYTADSIWAGNSYPFSDDFYNKGISLEYKISWKPNKLVKFITNGGSEIDDYEFIYNVDIGDLYKNIPTKDGFIFAGWYKDADLSLFADEFLSEETILYADWIAKSYDVTKNNLETTLKTILADLPYINEVRPFSLIISEDEKEFFAAFVEKQSVDINYSGIITANEISILKEAMELKSPFYETDLLFINLDLSKSEGLTDLPEEAFCGCTGLHSIKISEKLSNIGTSAFDRCEQLKSVTLPASIKIIGEFAFQRCSSLESITIPQGTNTIGSYAFKMCKNLKTVSLPNSLTILDEGAFKACYALEEISLPDNIKVIEKEMFSDCKNLTKVSMSSSVTVIKDYVFKGCENLSTIELPATLGEIGEATFKGCKALTSITLSDNISLLQAAVFCDCVNLKTINLDKVQVIEDSAFECCEVLENPTFASNLTTIGKKAFLNCNALTELTLPSLVTELKESCFNNCINLKKINIPVGVQILSYHCFDGCTALETVTFDNAGPSQLLRIEDRAFADCVSLKYIQLPDAVEVIETCAFYNCSGLNDIITIPATVLRIGNSAFKGCSNLKKITLENPLGWYKTTSPKYENGKAFTFDNDKNEETAKIFVISDYDKFWYRDGTPTSI